MAHPVDAFGLQLYSRVCTTPGNLFFSPYSIWACLALTRPGAVGQTASELDALFGFPGDLDAFQAALRERLKPGHVHSWSMDTQSTEHVPAYALNIANALWGQVGFSFEPAFVETLATDYGAPLERIDYAETEAARARINDWVAEQTQQRIKDIVPPGLPTPDTRLVLANAIYFKAAWENEFWEAGTKKAVFHSPGGDVEVDMMQLETHLGYAEDDSVQVAELDYQGGDASMVFVLPKQGSLESIEAGLAADRIQSWVSKLSRVRVAMRLPRFTFTTPLNLTDILPAMGVPSAFDAQAAEFSAMANVPGQPLYLGVVLHKAFVAVDEKGTEAAAATIGMMKAEGMPPPEVPIPFVADRPFLFLIRHKKAGCALFLGRLADPSMS